MLDSWINALENIKSLESVVAVNDRIVGFKIVFYSMKMREEMKSKGHDHHSLCDFDATREDKVILVATLEVSFLGENLIITPI